jgi:serine/threonine-protein kinase
MERLVGTDLGELLKTKPVRDLDEVVEITRAVAAGLDAAHAAGIVHRDLKPSNVFAAVGDDDAITWKVLDFGVSKIRGEATLTRAHVVGTPSYMAPEQARGDAVDARADIYALGVMIYRLLTGRPVVTPRDAPAMMLDVVFRMPARPSDFIAITAEVEAVLAIALAKRPADRFANIRELADALADAASRPMPELVARGAVLLARTPWGSWAAEDTAPRIERKMDCPDNDDLTALLDGVLASDRQAAVEAHVAACAACRAVLGELVALAGTDDTAPA